MAMLAGGLGGCVNVAMIQIPPAAPYGAEVAPPSVSDASAVDTAYRSARAWPRRWGWGGWGGGGGGGGGGALADIRAGGADSGALGTVGIVEGRLLPVRPGTETSKEVEREMRSDIAMLIAARENRTWSPVTVVGEGRGAYVFTEGPLPPQLSDRPPHWPSFTMKFVSGSRNPLIASTGGGPGAPGDTISLQRTWMAFYDAAPGTQSRGLAVVLPGIFGTPWNVIDQAVGHLRAQGWSVLRLVAHPSRFTEKATFRISDSADIDEQAKLLAAVLSDRSAECAYAVEAGVREIERQRPALKGCPRLAFGMSGGAMVLPTVVALNPDAYVGAVMVAGGCDLLTTSVLSNYSTFIDALSVEDISGKPLGGPRLRALSEAYLKVAPLDPYYTVRALASKPILMVHAAHDLAVPACQGDLLWERAGKPERWVYDVGHEILFFQMSSTIDKISDWVEAKFPAPQSVHQADSTAQPAARPHYTAQ